MKNIYLDHAATTPVRPEVIEAMTPFFSEVFANSSSLHLSGQKARRAPYITLAEPQMSQAPSGCLECEKAFWHSARDSLYTRSQRCCAVPTGWL